MKQALRGTSTPRNLCEDQRLGARMTQAQAPYRRAFSFLSFVLCTALTSSASAASQAGPTRGDEGPEVERGLVSNEEGAQEGFTLFTPIRSTTTYLVGMDGEVGLLSWAVGRVLVKCQRPWAEFTS